MTDNFVQSIGDIAEVRSYLNRIGAEVRSMRVAVIRLIKGKYWEDTSIIKFSLDGDIECASLDHMPTDFERTSIKQAFVGLRWPELNPVPRLDGTGLPDMIKDADKRDIYEFRNERDLITMIQVRIQKEGDKNYVPWTHWTDGKWRPCEPDGSLPLYGLDRLKDASVVFIHEGAKAARFVQEMVDAETDEAKKLLADHPWGRELVGAAHLGWIGGALNPYRTDWAPIMRNGITRAYIVTDNDESGRAALPKIAQSLRIPCFNIQFTDDFPSSFDLADKFPEKLYGSADDGRFYTGPSFRECLHPATWATDLVPPASGNGRPTARLRDSFKGLWAYVEEADAFVCTDMPEFLRSESVLNKMLASFSHSNETAKLITKAYQGRSVRLCYRPDHPGQVVTFRGSSAINLHTPTNIKPGKGDPKPWLEFLEYMFVDPDERKEVERWCATLIAKPEIRMAYGLLLISEKQGIGKTTLGANILAPLVGIQNVGFPGENDVTSAFNEWVAHKRLAIIGEIYSGSSWKAYHALKSVITDRDITVNQKYMRQYTIENWCHVLASSNSMRALKMENDDRRWFYPEVTEVPWPKAKFEALRKWITGGGLSIIYDWALKYRDYVSPSERAPMTARKQEMIEGSRSEAQSEAAALATVLKDMEKPAGVLIKDVVGWVKQSVQGRVYDTDYEIRRAMTDMGLTAFSKRIKVGGRLQYVLINDPLRDIAQRAEDPIPEIRTHLIKCNDVMEGLM